MTRVVGVTCAVLSVALLFYAVWLSAGGASGMPSLLVGLGLLLVAALTLRLRRRGRASR
jgi:uncharacterized membrane protein